MDHVAGAGVFPVVLGGDHSIGHPDIRGLAPHIEGNIGIIHLDRHVDIQEKDMDERMHTTPWFHATNIPNAPAKNLVQCGIGGWQAPRSGVEVARERQTTVMTIGDVEAMGVDRAAGLAAAVFAVLPDAAGLSEMLHGSLQHDVRTLASASAPSEELCVARVLAGNAPALYRALNLCREAARELLELPAGRGIW